jgi:hypothetical protein
MANQQDVRRLALSLPDTIEGEEHFAFAVLNKGEQNRFAWVWLELTEPDEARTPNLDVLAIRVANRAEKDALLASDRDKFFTEPHYNSFPAVLVRLPAISEDELQALLTDAWRCMAPRTLVKEFDQRAAL